MEMRVMELDYRDWLLRADRKDIEKLRDACDNALFFRVFSKDEPAKKAGRPRGSKNKKTNAQDTAVAHMLDHVPTV